jgi:hypothetical protein
MMAAGVVVQSRVKWQTLYLLTMGLLHIFITYDVIQFTEQVSTSINLLYFI